MIVIS